MVVIAGFGRIMYQTRLRGGLKTVKVKKWNIREIGVSGKQSGRTRAGNMLALQNSGANTLAGEAPSLRQNAGDIMRELYALVGLREVKKLIEEIYAFVEIQRRRQKENLMSEPLVMHMIFKGNPGTGKTTVARILGKLFKEVGVLPKGHLIEVERADLVGEFIGHTAQKTREQMKKALGGILFVDEAYSLTRGGEKDFGREAIDTMVNTMVNNPMCLFVIYWYRLTQMN